MYCVESTLRLNTNTWGVRPLCIFRSLICAALMAFTKVMSLVLQAGACLTVQPLSLMISWHTLTSRLLHFVWIFKSMHQCVSSASLQYIIAVHQVPCACMSALDCATAV